MEPGTRIGDYEILDELGRGGMGRVYRVRNVISERFDAMKVLLPSLAGHEELAARFLREIKVLAALDHPNIAALRTALTAGDQIVMIMELVDGEPLARRLRRGPLAVSEAIACMEQVLSALAYAHDRHVIHRDVKPANVMVTPDGVVKLTDFGIARSVRDESLTATGTTTGSLPYIAPEQIAGGAVDARSDIYAAGITLYEMVTGRTPFQGTSEYSLMSAHLNEAPRPAIEWRPDLPGWLNDSVMRAIRKAPGERFQSASEFRAALVAHGNTETAVAATEILHRLAAPAAPALGSGAPRRRAAMAHPVVYAALGAVAIVALAAGTGAYLRRAEAGGDAADRPPPLRMVDTTGDRALAPDERGAVTPEGTPGIQRIEPGRGADSRVAAAAPEPRVSPRTTAEGAPSAGARASRRETSAAGPVVQEERQTPLQDAAAAPVQLPPADTSSPTLELARITDELDALAVRASVVDESLATLRQEQMRRGLGLRGDILARQRSMQLNLTRAAEAVERGDATEAARYRRMAQAELDALETFLGR